MGHQRVYVIWAHPLFHESVRLLLRQSQVDLVGATSDHEVARTQIRALTPDVVIIEETNGEEQSSEETIAILQTGSRVIRLSLTNNELSFYRREQRTVEKVEDLVSLISHDPHASIG